MLGALPEAPQRSLYDAFELQVRYHRPRHEVTIVEDPDDPNEPGHQECLIMSRDRSQLLFHHRPGLQDG